VIARCPKLTALYAEVRRRSQVKTSGAGLVAIVERLQPRHPAAAPTIGLRAFDNKLSTRPHLLLISNNSSSSARAEAVSKLRRFTRATISVS
jgi:hypothetical protein